MRISDWSFRRVLFRSEEIIERHRREADPDHRRRGQRGDDSGTAVPSACRVARQLGPIIRAMVMKKKRKASPPRIQPIRFARLRWRRRYSASSNGAGRSEEHTSELQSLMRISYAVFCLKKKQTTKQTEKP